MKIPMERRYTEGHCILGYKYLKYQQLGAKQLRPSTKNPEAPGSHELPTGVKQARL
jgi:hypothetical protein